MYFGHPHKSHYCRWCGDPYEAGKATNKDGFCKSPCKQAHYRAYKKYVTNSAAGKPISACCRLHGK